MPKFPRQKKNISMLHLAFGNGVGTCGYHMGGSEMVMPKVELHKSKGF